MCLNLDLFESNEVNTSYHICPIGKGVIDNAIGFNCKINDKTFIHAVCKSCYTSYSNKNVCPICNTNDSRRVPLVISCIDDNIYGKVLKCVAHESGCTWKDSYMNYSIHVEKCQYQLVECPHCKKDYVRSEIHDHQNTCSQKKIKCDHCYTTYIFGDRVNHENKTQCPHCSQLVVNCRYNYHEKDCPEKIIECDKCAPKDETSLSLINSEEYTFKIKDQIDHIKNKCKYRLVVCTECSRKIEYCKLTEHQIVKTCEDCSNTYHRCKEKHNNDCPQRIVICEYCSESYVHRDKKEHDILFMIEHFKQIIKDENSKLKKQISKTRRGIIRIMENRDIEFDRDDFNSDDD